MRNKSIIATTLIFMTTLLPATAISGPRDMSFPHAEAPGEPIYPAIAATLVPAPETRSIRQVHLRSTRTGDLIVAAPTPGRSGKGDTDIIIAKIDPDDATILAWMIIGGSGDEWVGGLALDNNEKIVITGASDSPDFPLSDSGLSSPPPSPGQRKTFLCRIDSDLKRLEQSAFPVSGDGLALTIGKDGGIYVGGRTTAGEFAEKKPGMTPRIAPGPNGYVIRVDPQSWQVSNATFIGGREPDWVRGMTINKKGELVVIGNTISNDFPFTPTAWQSAIPVDDNAVFVAIFDPDLKKIKTATAINGSRIEKAGDVTIGRNDSIIVTGWTSSPDFPSTRGDKYHGGGDAFVVKLSNDLKSLESARIFGGKGMDSGKSLTGEAGTFIVMAMESDSPLITGIKQTLVNPGEKDIDLLFLGPNLKLLRPAYSGTDHPDHNPALALGEGNRVILAGIEEKEGKTRLFLSEHNLY